MYTYILVVDTFYMQFIHRNWYKQGVMAVNFHIFARNINMFAPATQPSSQTSSLGSHGAP